VPLFEYVAFHHLKAVKDYAAVTPGTLLFVGLDVPWLSRVQAVRSVIICQANTHGSIDDTFASLTQLFNMPFSTKFFSTEWLFASLQAWDKERHAAPLLIDVITTEDVTKMQFPKSRYIRLEYR